MGGTRKELGAFLRQRREQLVRGEFGLPPVARSRVIGLRREEVAVLAGVSVTWYTWLEQGRDINPSRQVLDAVADKMRLSAAEHEYVLALAGFATAPSDNAEQRSAILGHLQPLLDTQLPSPAFAMSRTWDIVAWNRAYEVIYPDIARLSASDRNMLALIFTDDRLREMLPDWSITSRQFLAEYRASAVTHLFTDPAHEALVSRLREESPEFSRAWREHEIGRFTSRERRFRHPIAGDLVFDHHQLTPSEAPEINVVIYLARAGSATRERMSRLVTDLAGA